MLTFGHTAGAYLITQAPPFFKIKLKRREIFLVLLAGNIYDMDVVWSFLSGTPIGAHHLFFGHTPLMGLFYFLIFYLIFRKKMGSAVFILIALALFLHLFLDDLSYILSLVGLTAYAPPEIFWLFPFDARRTEALKDFLTNRGSYQFNIVDYMKYYTTKTLLVFLLELILILTAVLVFVKKRFGAK